MRFLLISLIKLILHFMYIFPVKRNYVYLINFNGLSYGADARAVADYLHEKFCNKYRIYMEVNKKDNFICDNPEVTPINKKSFLSLYYAMICEIIICNFVPRSYVPYRKEQIIINTWHGNPLKKVGKYAINYNKDAYLS